MFAYRDATALITGASSGLGAVFASALAARGMHLILIARSQPTLEALAQRLATQHGIHATAIAADLADPEAPDRIRAGVVERGLRVDLLVNNAGFGLGGAFLSHDLAQETAQIQVDLVALVALTHRFVPDMVGRQQGGDQPRVDHRVPADGLCGRLRGDEELRAVVQRGAWTRSGGGRRPGARGLPRTGDDQVLRSARRQPAGQALDPPERIGADALKAFDRRRRVVIPGRFRSRALAFGTRLLPRVINARLGEQIARQYFPAPAGPVGKR
jgi:uncharacterized protein